MSDCATKTRGALEAEEERHVGLINDMISTFHTGQIELETDTGRHGAILSLVEGRVIALEEQGALGDGLRDQLIARTYIYYSYVFHRALRYFRNGNTCFDRNDYEDGRVCLHLRLDTRFCLVTQDASMREALKETVALLQRLDKPHIRTSLRVSDVAHLRDLYSCGAGLVSDLPA